MKAIKTYFKVSVLSVLLLGCSAEEPAELDPSLAGDNTPPPVVLTQDVDGTDGVPQFFRAKIDGTDFEAAATDFNAVMSEDGQTIDVWGKVGSEVITLKIPAAIPSNNITNPYVLGNYNTPYVGIYNKTNTQSYIAHPHGLLQTAIDGDVWSADVPTVTVGNGVTTISGIVGNQGESLVITLNQTAVGNYTFGPDGGNINTAVYNHYGQDAQGNVVITPFSSDVAATNGSINITEIDAVNNLITGSFSFTGTDALGNTKTIDQGNFTNIPFTGTTGFMSATIEYTDPVTTNMVSTPFTSTSHTTTIINGVTQVTGTNGTDTVTMVLQTDQSGAIQFGPLPANASLISTGLYNDGTNDYNTDSSALNGNANLTIDTANKLLSGTFEFDGNNAVVNPTLVAPLKQVKSGTFNSMSYSDGTLANNFGLNIALNVVGERIVGTFSFVSISLGVNPAESYIISEGAFDVEFLTAD